MSKIFPELSENVSLQVLDDLCYNAKEFRAFLRGFDRGEALNSLPVYGGIIRKWKKHPPYKHCQSAVTRDDMRQLAERLSSPGVYAILIRERKRARWECFYVGISGTGRGTICGRVKRHLTDDVSKDYGSWHGNGFAVLKKCAGVIICCAKISGLDCTKRTKRELVVLERCLEIGMRPRFLVPRNNR